MLFLLNGYPPIRMASPWHPNEPLDRSEQSSCGHGRGRGSLFGGCGGREEASLGYRPVFFLEFLETTRILFWSTKVNISGGGHHGHLPDVDVDGYADGYIRHSHEEGDE